MPRPRPEDPFPSREALLETPMRYYDVADVIVEHEHHWLYHADDRVCSLCGCKQDMVDGRYPPGGSNDAPA